MKLNIAMYWPEQQESPIKDTFIYKKRGLYFCNFTTNLLYSFAPLLLSFFAWNFNQLSMPIWHKFNCKCLFLQPNFNDGYFINY